MTSAQVNNVLCPKAYMINRYNVKGLHPLPPVPVSSVRCPLLKLRTPLKITTNALKCKQSMPVCVSGGETRARDGNQEPLWKSFGKTVENFGKKSSVEDILKQQIEKQEYYDEGGNPPGGRGGGSSGGGGGGFGGSEEEGFAGVLDETIQVILATLGFIFAYFYILHGAEMSRVFKDYIKYKYFGGRLSFRLKRAFAQWNKYRKVWKKMIWRPRIGDRFWLERAIIRTPTWWDHPAKYRKMAEDYLRRKSRQSHVRG